MRQRCNNPNCRNYKNYGARGVTVCAEWEDPKKFFLWANVAGYDDGLTIDITKNGTGGRTYTISQSTVDTVDEEWLTVDETML